MKKMPAMPPFLAHFGEPPHRRFIKGVAGTSLYLPMRDGVRIALDVLLPHGLAADERIPAVMVMTRYWRSFRLRGITPPRRAPIGPREMLPDQLVACGFAVVVVDARGSGASHGVSRYPWDAEELADYDEVAAWIRRQAWSNGRLGAYGLSYEGATALRLAGAPGVEAVVPLEIEYDVFADIAFPGGIRNAAFLEAWSASNRDLDAGRPSALFPRLARFLVKGVRPVDADRKHGRELAAAIADHAANTDVARAMVGIENRDDPFGGTGVTLDDFSVPAVRARIEGSGAALFTWGSWMDGASAEAALRLFHDFSNAQLVVIGAWRHEMHRHAGPRRQGRPADPPSAARHAALTAFFARTLAEQRPPEGKRIFYYTMNEDAWKETAVFPPAGSVTETWYCGPAGSLAREAPAVAAADPYTVDFRATTGRANRWLTQMARPLSYPDRARADRRLLVYDSAPLAADLEITGYPAVSLFVASSETDGAFFAYLEEVDERGVVRYLTEGQLRGVHRHTLPAPFPGGMPRHPCRRRDRLPLVPGEVTELVIGLWPTSVLVRRGSRLRLAFAGADADTFARVPEVGTPQWLVQRAPGAASCLRLPVVPRG